MRGRSQSRRSKPVRRSERGAVAVEAALITPVLVLILFGIIEFGLVFKDDLAITSAVRAGARMGSAEPEVSTFAQDAANQVGREGTALDPTKITQLWVYRADPANINKDGRPVGGSVNSDGTFSNCTTCVKFTWNSSSKTFVPRSDSPGWNGTTINACQNDPNRDSVGVYMEFKHSAVTGLIFNNMTLHSHTVMSFEPQPVTTPCKP
jgi:Flp pilus assembly protein TadG